MTGARVKCLFRTHHRFQNDYMKATSIYYLERKRMSISCTFSMIVKTARHYVQGSLVLFRTFAQGFLKDLENLENVSGHGKLPVFDICDQSWNFTNFRPDFDPYRLVGSCKLLKICRFPTPGPNAQCLPNTSQQIRFV